MNSRITIITSCFALFLIVLTSIVWYGLSESQRPDLNDIIYSPAPEFIDTLIQPPETIKEPISTQKPKEETTVPKITENANCRYNFEPYPEYIGREDTDFPYTKATVENLLLKSSRNIVFIDNSPCTYAHLNDNIEKVNFEFVQGYYIAFEDLTIFSNLTIYDQDYSNKLVMGFYPGTYDNTYNLFVDCEEVDNAISRCFEPKNLQNNSDYYAYVRTSNILVEQKFASTEPNLNTFDIKNFRQNGYELSNQYKYYSIVDDFYSDLIEPYDSLPELKNLSYYFSFYGEDLEWADDFAKTFLVD